MDVHDRYFIFCIILPEDLRSVNLAFRDAWCSLGHVSNWFLAYSWESFDRAQTRRCGLFTIYNHSLSLSPKHTNTKTDCSKNSK